MLTMFGSLGVLVAMFVHARTVPLNYFLLASWTILQAITVGSIVTFFDAEVVIQALLLTVLVVGGLFVYTLQSKRDFQKHYALLFTVSCVFIGAICLQVISAFTTSSLPFSFSDFLDVSNVRLLDQCLRSSLVLSLSSHRY